MADQNITALPKKTSSQMAATDYLMGIDSAEGYQMLIQDLGDYIIQHATSSLAGANQTLAAAVNALNSKTTITVITNASLLTWAESLQDGYWFFRTNATVSDLPTESLYLFGYALVKDNNRHIFAYNMLENVSYERLRTNNIQWTSWSKLPTRSEMNFAIKNLGNPNTAGFHNAIYRGKNITSYLTDGSLWDRIKGTNGYALFDDLFLGDYITVGSNSYAIVDFDYYLRTGSVDITEHHIVMMPVNNMNIPAGTVLYGSSDTLTLLNGSDVTSKETATAFKWNATSEAPNTNNTNGGYKFSRMRTVIMKAADTIVVNAFGASHVKPITVLYPNPSDASASGLASSWGWCDKNDWSHSMRKSICDLPNETQIYGQQIWGRGNAYTNVGYEIGVDKFQFAICALHKLIVNNRASSWLRSVNSDSNAAHYASDGTALTGGSAYALGVRPRFVLVG